MADDRYKLLSEDDKKFDIHDANDGSQFSVAKRAVHPATQIKIMKMQKFVNGGTVLPQEQAPSLFGPPSLDIGEVQRTIPAQSDIIPQAPTVGDNWSALFDPGNRSTLETLEAQQNPNKPTMVEPQPTQPQGEMGIDPSIQAQPMNQDQTALGIPGLDALQQSQNLMNAGLQGEANALSNKSRQDTKAYDAYNSALAEHQKNYEDRAAAVQMHLDDIQKNIASNEVDYNRYWSNKSTGGKAATIIGVLLSGIGAGLQGTTRNMAVEMLEKSIDRDVMQQKDELGKKQTLFSDNLRMLGDVRQAETATRLQLTASLQGQIDKIAAQTNDPLVQARRQQLQSMAMDRKLPLQIELAQAGAMQMAKQKLRQGPITPEQAAALPGDLHKNMAPLPNGMMVYVNEPKDAEKLKNFSRYRTHLSSQLQELKAAVHEKGTEEIFGSHAENLERLTTAIANDTAKMFDPDSANRESEIKNAKSMLFTPNSFKSALTRTKTSEQIIDKYDEWVNKRMMDEYRSIGVPVNSTMNMSAQEKAFYNWAKANPKDPDAQKVLKKLGNR